MNPIQTYSKDGVFFKIFHFEKPYYTYDNGDKMSDIDYENNCNLIMDACTTELLIRYHLRRCDFEYASNFLQTDEDMDKVLTELFSNVSNISTHFMTYWTALRKKVMFCSQVTLQIELGDATVPEEIDDLSTDWTRNEARIKERIKELYELLVKARQKKLVHLDLKPLNLLKVERNGQKDRWVLNDFDTSLLLKPLTFTQEKCRVGRTLPYAAKEALGTGFKSYKAKTGYAVDVFSASLIAYQLLNDGELPDDTLNPNDETERIGDFRLIEEKQKENESGFPPPRHGEDWLKRIVLAGLSVDQAKRPTAADIVRYLEDPSSIPSSSWINKMQFTTEEPGGVSELDSPVSKKGVTQNGKKNIYVEGDMIIYPQPKPTPPPPPESKWKIIISVILGLVALLILIGPKMLERLPAAPVEHSIPEESLFEMVYETATVPETTVADTTTTSSDTTVETTTLIVTDNTSQSNGAEEKGGITSIVTEGKQETDAPRTTFQTETVPPETTVTTFKYFYRNTTYSIPYYESDGSIQYLPLSGIEITGYNGYFSGGVLDIPADIDGVLVVGIGPGAFNNLENKITELIIPNVEYIGNNAFKLSFIGNNLNLERVRYIGAHAFENCTELLNVSFSDRLRFIGERAFWDDNNAQRYYNYNMDSSTWRTMIISENQSLGAEGTYNLPDA